MSHPVSIEIDKAMDSAMFLNGDGLPAPFVSSECLFLYTAPLFSTYGVQFPPGIYYVPCTFFARSLYV